MEVQITDISFRKFRILKDVLQCKLHDPGTARSGTGWRLAWRCAACSIVLRSGIRRAAQDSPKRVGTAEICSGKTWAKAVGYVERLSSDLNPLLFPDLELSGDGFVPLPISRPHNGVVADIAIRARCWGSKSRRVQIVGHGFSITV